MKVLISIITPTYNRAHLLPRAYESLVHQTNHNFEWIVVDDGSQDQTQEVIQNFDSALFSIKYFKKKNGGKHTALNFGVQKASGDFILMLDSDDLLPMNAIETITGIAENLPKEIGGIVGRKSDLNLNLVGSQDDFDQIISNSIDIRYTYGILGDLTEVFRTEVFKNNLFPEIQNEKFCPEVLVWNRIAQKHNLLFFNQSIYIADYQSGGLTDKIVKIRMQSPKATMLTYSELGRYKIPFREKIKANINFWRFSFNDKDWPFKRKLSMSNKILFPLALPLGLVMYWNDRRNLK